MSPVDYFGTPLVDQKYVVVANPGLPEDMWAKCFYINVTLKPRHGHAIEILEYPEFILSLTVAHSKLVFS